MTNKNPEACRKWYGRMKQNPDKLQAYRERKRTYMRNYRNHGQTTRQAEKPKRQQAEQQRETGSKQLGEVDRGSPTETPEAATLT
jgi:hypothetical protein